MTRYMAGTREHWLAARLELLEAEKELTRRSDELARRRQEPGVSSPRQGPRRMVAARAPFVDGWLAALESVCVC